VTNFSVHDVALVDSPAFHFTMDTCSNGEVYNMIIRGGNEGGLDGFDIWGSNIWVHDVEVTNKDECVTVKSPANNILVENVFCNWSGGCAIGSLGANTAISNVLYRNIYTQNANQMMMIKSNGGSGSLTNAQFLNFQGHANAYTLDLDANWSSQTKADGNGVQYKNLTFSGWKGTCLNGAQRAPIQVLCPSAVPCTGITISNFNVWTEAGSSELYKCANAYGTGGCLKGGSGGAYSSTATVKSAS
jgi:rhamnogalacturonan hydrolase